MISLKPLTAMDLYLQSDQWVSKFEKIFRLKSREGGYFLISIFSKTLALKIEQRM